jgi:hypothetical protein
MDAVFNPHPIKPGFNVGIGNYTVDPTSPNFNKPCALYKIFVTKTVPSLYRPNPTGDLLNALKDNLGYFYMPMKQAGCTQEFPYGQ